MGTNEQSFCAALIASSDPLIQAAGTSCQSDTTYACSYNSTSHTVICPARTIMARPSRTAWDAGAYQSPSVTQPRDQSERSCTVNPWVISQVRALPDA